ncbi:MAG TPA: hypothetical protein VIY49_25750 [Bryobacteraceae bacterium]
MRTSAWTVCAALLCRLAGAQAVSTVALSNGVQLKIAAQLGQPTGQQTLTVVMSRASGDSFYRVFRDQNGLAVFAYELAVSLSSSGNVVALTAKPVETAFAERFPDADGGKPVPTLSSVQVLEPIGSGSRAEIGLFELQGMGLKVVDTAEVVLGPSSEAGETASPNRLHLAEVKLKIDDMPIERTGPEGSVTGQYGMIYVPGRGAVLLSSGPVAAQGFVKAGTIDGSRLQFVWNNETYEADSAAPILDVEGSGELWVRFDPSYQPSGNWTKTRSPDDSSPATEEFFVAASDSLGWWLP